jgi:hypothetical protein
MGHRKNSGFRRSIPPPVVHAVPLTPAIFDHFRRNAPQGKNDKRRDHNDVVKVADDRKEIGDEVKRQQGVPHGETEERLREWRCPAIFQDEPVDEKFVLECLPDGRELTKKTGAHIAKGVERQLGIIQ